MSARAGSVDLAPVGYLTLSINVMMQTLPGHLSVTIEDDGADFNVEIPVQGRLGLLTMHERIEMLGGQLTIESAPGAGTTVYVEVPL